MSWPTAHIFPKCVIGPLFCPHVQKAVAAADTVRKLVSVVSFISSFRKCHWVVSSEERSRKERIGGTEVQIRNKETLWPTRKNAESRSVFGYQTTVMSSAMHKYSGPQFGSPSPCIPSVVLHPCLLSPAIAELQLPLPLTNALDLV